MSPAFHASNAALTTSTFSLDTAYPRSSASRSAAAGLVDVGVHRHPLDPALPKQRDGRLPPVQAPLAPTRSCDLAVGDEPNAVAQIENLLILSQIVVVARQ